MSVGARRRTIVRAAVVAVAALLALPASLALAAYPGANGRIAYVGFLPGDTRNAFGQVDSDLFTILPDGTGLQRLTDTPANEFSPAWSPDGQRLAFITAGSGGGSRVFTMNADGSEVRRLAKSRTLASPSFSPSGRRIAFTNGPAVKTMRADDGSGRRRVVRSVHPRGVLSNPQYSPDGRWIVFVGTPEGERRQGIWKVHRDGTGLRRLTGSVDDFDPEFSPDGRRIVFNRADALLLMRANGKNVHRIPPLTASASCCFSYPAFAAAGDRIVMTQGTPLINDDCADLYTITPAGSDLRQLTHNTDPANCDPGNPATWGAALDPSWQPLPTG